MFFLLSRYHQQRRAVPRSWRPKSRLISDYTFEKDALFARINLGGDELEMYYRVHEALAEKIPSPDLVVYLRASTDTLMQRIALRDRPYERQMERAYIDELNQAYDAYYLEPTVHRSPVLVIDTNALDYVRNPDHLTWVEEPHPAGAARQRRTNPNCWIPEAPMRITRETLLKIARDTAAQRVRPTTGSCASI